MTGTYLFDYKGGRMFVVPAVRHVTIVKISLWDRIKTFNFKSSTKEVVSWCEVLEDDQVLYDNGCFYANSSTANHLKSLSESGYKL